MHALADPASPDLARKSVPWIFYGQTTSLCETCWELVPAKIIGQDGKVFYQKRCPEHGVIKTLIEDDADYWLNIRRWLKPGDRPLFNASRTERGCPWDCGLCPDHEQHSCLAIVEINDACNLTCPVCFADSAVGKGGHKRLAEVETMLDAVVMAEGEPDLVQLSGGEPTIHPLFWEIVAAARARPIRHIMINTNGVRIAQEEGFAERLKAVGIGFEVYLQFDSLDDDALMELARRAPRPHPPPGARAARGGRRFDHPGLRGPPGGQRPGMRGDRRLCAAIFLRARRRLPAGAGCRPQRGFRSGAPPRHPLGPSPQHRRRRRVRGVATWCHCPAIPTRSASATASAPAPSVVPVTRLMNREDIVSAAPNTISFERDPALKARIFDLLSLSTVENNGESRLASLFCCLPGIEAPASLAYKDTFKVAIIQFLDRFNFDLGTVKRSCIHFATTGRPADPVRHL